jgi:hypothetical protein
MGYGIVRRPENEAGPGTDVDQLVLAVKSAVARHVCRICREPIGFDREFYRDPEAADQPPMSTHYVHAACLWKRIREEGTL